MSADQSTITAGVTISVAPAVSLAATDDRYASLSISPYGDSSGARATRNNGGGIQTRQEGFIGLKVAYTGNDSIRYEIVGGSGSSIERLGARTETQVDIIKFQGVQSVQFQGQNNPTVLQSTSFINSEGTSVSQPRFRTVSGVKEFYSTAPVWGSLVVSHVQDFEEWRLSYSVDDMIYGADREHVYDTLTALRVFVRAGFSAAHVQINRTVIWPQNNVILSKPTTNTKKQEISRHGVIHRVPSPEEPDPVTGAESYVDVEEVTKVVYGIFETDKNGTPIIKRNQDGHVYNAEAFETEYFSSNPPSDSYLLDTFVRTTDVQSS
jgi:hypothetical protein